jgi:hypothetical protein
VELLSKLVYTLNATTGVWLGRRTSNCNDKARAKTTAGSFDCAQDRLFDCGVHDKAVIAFAQKDNSMKVGCFLSAA